MVSPSKILAAAGTLLTGSCAPALLLPCSLFPHPFLLCVYSDPSVFLAEPSSVFDAFSLWRGTASSLCMLVSSPLFAPRKPLNNSKSTSAVALSRTGFSYSSGVLHLCPIFMPDLRWHISCSWQEVCKTSLALLGRGECCSSAKPLSSTSVFCPCCICQLSMLNITVHVHLISGTGDRRHFCCRADGSSQQFLLSIASWVFSPISLLNAYLSSTPVWQRNLQIKGSIKKLWRVWWERAEVDCVFVRGWFL